jgi:GNAT acetyltransferase-like protein
MLSAAAGAQCNGDLMQGIELQDYRGDFADIAELMRRVWIAEYGGKHLVPVPDPAFLRWRVGGESGALCPAAFDGTNLVGSMFSLPHSLRIGGSVVPVALYTAFTVDPAHRRLVLAMVERLRRENEERGIAFAIGMVPNDPSSISYRFWTKYAQTFPQKFRFLFRGSYWAKFLAPRELTRAALETRQRIAGRTLGPLLRLTPYGFDPHVRSFRAADLGDCAQLLDKASAGFDWALVWPPEQLAHYLANPTLGTLVFEKAGRVRGMVSYHCLVLEGREAVRAALIDLWADELAAVERVRLVSHLCSELRERGVHLVVAPHCAMMPTAAFLANLFLPGSEHFHVGAFFTRRMASVPPPKTWSFLVT